MILEKFGVITKTDLVNDKLSTASFKTQLGRRLIMRDHSSGILLSRGEEDFQGEGGSKSASVGNNECWANNWRTNQRRFN